MAVFGAPVAHEDDAERAVRAGLRILESALGDPAPEQPLRQAAELFGSMGYRPALAQTEALLEQTTALAS